MTDTLTPAAVEPMTMADDDPHMIDLRRFLAEHAGRQGSFRLDVAEGAALVARIDSLTAALDHAAIGVENQWDEIKSLRRRAIPAPRRYTGGPLEDGLYLWRWPEWRRGPFVKMTVEDGEYDLGRPRLVFGDWVWLIGPIPIPELPSEEAKL